jgi:hypothetical protein
VNLYNPAAPSIWAPRGRTLRDAYADQDDPPAVTLNLLSDHSRADAGALNGEQSGDVARASGPARVFLLRWPVGPRRVTGVTLAAAGCAATWAAVIAGGHLGRGAAVQVLFAAAMIVCALGETLLAPAVPVISGDRARPGAAGHRNRPGSCAVVGGCLLGPAAGGAALGAGWATSLLTTLAVACALAGIAAHHPAAGWHRPPAVYRQWSRTRRLAHSGPTRPGWCSSQHSSTGPAAAGADAEPQPRAAGCR